ncbi:MAG: cell division protein FtsZ [Bacteroidales bacterium]|jgi:cell division protein FtsZ|nr:cell division protein FtsZ [Bacteroidales bacterium]
MELINDNFTDYPIDFTESNAIIKVIGVGGGGCNVVQEIYKQGINNVDLLICNTDKQALDNNRVDEKIVLGPNIARNLGAGCNPKKGREAALASKEEISKALPDRIEMVFVTACLGGGTGTGAAPVIAEIAKKKGKLVVGVVTIPFRDEGKGFMTRAMDGLRDLRQYVDSLLIIDNQKIYEAYGDQNMINAFKRPNEVLVTAVKSISEIIVQEGEINVDMNDVRMVMENSGMTTMGIGEAEGEGKAQLAVEEAFKSPLLNDCELKSSTGLLVNIVCSGDNFTMTEFRQALEAVKSFTGQPLNYKRGLVYDPNLGNKVRVTVVATGFDVLNLPDVDGRNIVIPGRNGETYHPDPIRPKNPDEGKMPPVLEFKPEKRVAGTKPVLVTDVDSEIIQLESVPAYERKNKKKNSGAPTSNLNTFSVTEIGERPTLTTNNRYLHQTQD